MNKDTRKPSLLGGTMIITGTTVGAGMLANPTSMAGVWFIGSVILLVYTWFCMMTSGLMILEANLHYPKGASFPTIVKDLLGDHWNWITGLSIAFVLYILTYAYVTSGGGMTQALLQHLFPTLPIPRSIGSLIFCFGLGFFVWISTKAVDRFNVILLGGMVIAFLYSSLGLIASAKATILFNTLSPANEHYYPYILGALPVCLVSFGFHGNVPSLVKYYRRDGKRVAKVIFLGTGLSLVIYLLWQLAVQGNLPRADFAPVIAKNGDIHALLTALSNMIKVETLTIALRFFAYMAIASSFLGVTLGLFDYISDLFKLSDNTKRERIKICMISFLPPLILSLLFPYGFVMAIGYAGLAATVWTGIVPALLVKAARKKFNPPRYQVYGGNFIIYFIIVFAMLNIFAQIAQQFHLLPIFTG
ncbi:tryptophan permease [Actinobacillus delphinicola]|uniref:aromatic amino acid transporter n=1 Tax=Actinobacillus delphinicola TaxID=51161 RepID=UPI002441CA5A|nr:aromatic amino acid transporter [Actinobacillus delphinicola]MDG6897122.1 tryptophan permease [Actinobacillus delphinicola]